MPTNHLVSVDLRVAHLAGFFLHISPFQIINPDNFMTLFEDAKLWNHHFFMYGISPPTTSVMLKVTLTLCTHKRKTFLSQIGLQSSSPLLNFLTRKCVLIPLCVKHLKSVLVAKENAVRALRITISAAWILLHTNSTFTGSMGILSHNTHLSILYIHPHVNTCMQCSRSVW